MSPCHHGQGPVIQGTEDDKKLRIARSRYRAQFLSIKMVLRLPAQPELGRTAAAQRARKSGFKVNTFLGVKMGGDKQR